jgi:hypothetical protein
MNHRPEKLPWLADLTDYGRPALVMRFLLSGFPYGLAWCPLCTGWRQPSRPDIARNVASGPVRGTVDSLRGAVYL